MTSKRSRLDFETDRTTASSRPPFVFYGTPLPPLDSETRDDGSYVPLWKQEVRDERGRKRLHGAFTGGFSAGYFNTVGSKEGWAPSTFVSSRTNRRKDDAPRKAEDLMDEEDLADLQESQVLETQANFAGLGTTEEDGRRRGFVAELFRDDEGGIGVQLLQRMGWKPGQGLGTKVLRSARTGRVETESGTDKHLFAPDDVPMISFNRKTDKFGLGWTGEKKLTHSANNSSVSKFSRGDSPSDDEDGPMSGKPLIKRKKAAKKSSFGVGILNDTGSDDDDPFELGPKISYNKVIGGDKKRRAGGLTASMSTSKTPFKATNLLDKLKSQPKGTTVRRCSDGRPALDGFILATQSLTLDDADRYPAPKLPTDWVPKQPLMSGDTAQTKFQSTSEAAKASSMDPGKRSAVLGEQTLPGKSIFDFISAASRDKLVQATGASLPQGKGESAPAGFEATPAQKQKSLWALVPRLDRSTAQAALDRSSGASGWMPYSEDDQKRARYSAYLSTVTGARSELPPRKEGSSVDEWEAEMREFAQAALVFRPVSGLMASRFTTAKSDPHKPSSPANTEVLEGTETVGGLDTSRSRVAEEKEEDSAEQAARLGMYGPLTRTRASFYPTRLTCKRFGVPVPAHVLNDPGGKQGDGRHEQDKQKFDVVGTAKLDELRGAAAAAAAAAATAVNDSTSTGSDIHLASRGRDAAIESSISAAAVDVPQPRAMVDVERNDALEGRRAGEELFRTIFGDDDDDD